MPAPPVSAEFLADLELVCPTRADSLADTFLADLDLVYADARVSAQRQREVAVADLASLGESLTAWREHNRRLLASYLDRLPADDPLLNPVSLFGTLDYGRLETAHTRSLAWLLGNREHGFGFRLLESLLARLGLDGTSVRAGRVESEVPIRSGHHKGDAGRLDVLAEGQLDTNDGESSWRLVIEGKIDADEGEDQLARYDEWIERRTPADHTLRVFLTEDGREAQTSSEGWQCLSFLELATVFRRAASELRERPGYHFLRYYLTGVLRDVCGVPVPVSASAPNPYAAVEYLRSVFPQAEVEDGDGERR
jgi:hypothetical protein